jgi:putative transposase
VLGAVRNVTVSALCGKWFVSIQTEREVEQPMPSATGAIGIDVGIKRFATFSDGTVVAPLGSFRKHEARLARYQRAMSGLNKSILDQSWAEFPRQLGYKLRWNGGWPDVVFAA